MQRLDSRPSVHVFPLAVLSSETLRRWKACSIARHMEQLVSQVLLHFYFAACAALPLGSEKSRDGQDSFSSLFDFLCLLLSFVEPSVIASIVPGHQQSLHPVITNWGTISPKSAIASRIFCFSWAMTRKTSTGRWLEGYGFDQTHSCPGVFEVMVLPDLTTLRRAALRCRVRSVIFVSFFRFCETTRHDRP